MTWTDRTAHIKVSRTDDGTFRATEHGSTLEGEGSSPMAAIIDYARECAAVNDNTTEVPA